MVGIDHDRGRSLHVNQNHAGVEGNDDKRQRPLARRVKFNEDSTYVETSHRREGAHLTSPVRHDVTTEAKLLLQKLVQRPVVLTSVGVVDHV